MISQKIKSIRVFLGLSQLQTAKLLCISAYLYKRCEVDSSYVTLKTLIAISCMYSVPIELIADDKYSIEDVLSFETIKNVYNAEEKEQILISNILSNIGASKFSQRELNMFLNKKYNNILETIKNENQDRINGSDYGWCPTVGELIDLSEKSHIFLSDIE